MAEAFLSQLLRVENCVQEHRNSGGGERCMICLEKCGTLCERTGVVEYEMRLPCKHTVGSRCIATWLDPTGNAKNSCPSCRYVFFPTQPRPYFEHGITGEDEGIPLDTAEDLRARGYVVNETWGLLGPRGEILTSSNGHGGNAEAQIANETADDERYIGGLRRSMRLRGTVRVPPVQANIPARSARQRGNAQNDDDDDAVMYDEDVDEGASGLQTIQTICETFCYRLNLNANSRAIEISQRIAQQLLERTDIATRYGFLPHPAIAAVAVFVASHLTGMPKTMGWVAMNASVSIGDIGSLYRYFYHTYFRDFLDEEMLTMIGRGDRETVLGFLPEAN